MSTVLDLISSAMRLIGALASGEVPNANEANDAFNILNDMLDSWNNERLAIYVMQQSTYTPVTLKQVYTLGAGGDINQARPPRLDRMSVIWLANPAQPLELPMEKLDLAQWQAIPVKSVSSTLPLKFYNDDGFPLMNISLWPIPSTANIELALYMWQALAGFTSLTQAVSFPPGYARALRYNLAVDLSPEFGRQADPQVLRVAMEAKGVVKALNEADKVPVLQCEPELSAPGAYYNWRTDQPAGR